MKSLKFYLFIIFIILGITLFSTVTFASSITVYGKYTAGNLTLTSYSKAWTNDNLKDLYLELLNNFHGDEFNCLKNIFIYPNAPYGVNGYYKEDTYIQNGVYTLGDSASIEIFNGDKFDTIYKIAPILSHEYGHHYTIYNMYNYEGVYMNNYEDSEYYKIRNLDKYPVSLKHSEEEGYIYHWDILELLAYDYTQLLGSSNARSSVDFKDLKEILEENLNFSDIYNNSFNSMPQKNLDLPLASEVEGLYAYLLKIGGYTSSVYPKLSTYPVIKNITASKTLDDKVMFSLEWSSAEGLGTLEYTLIMYPVGNPFSITPIKTVSALESLTAVFGNYAIKKGDGSINSISQQYPEEVVFRIYIKDSKSYIYSSNPITYNLKELEKNLNKIETANTTTTKNNSSNKPSTNINSSPSKTQSPSNSNLNFNVSLPKNDQKLALSNSIMSMLKYLKV